MPGLFRHPPQPQQRRPPNPDLYPEALAATTADSLAITDVATRGVMLFRTASDSLAITDAVTRTFAGARSSADALAITDAADAISTIARDAADSLAITDAVTRVVVLARTAADSIAIADAVTRQFAGARSSADSLAITDATVRAVAFARTAADALAITDAVTRDYGGLARAAADSLAISDAVTRALVLARSVADALAITDAVTRGVVLPRSAADSLAITDAAVRDYGVLARFAADTLAITDAVTRLAVRPRFAFDTLAITDAATWLLFHRHHRRHLIQYHAVVYSPDANGGPGLPKLELDPDMLNLVWQQNQNLPGQVAFALQRRSKKVDQIAWMVDHIKVFRESSSGIRTLFAGKLVKPALSASDILVYGWDYLAFLQLSVTGYRTLYPTKMIGSEIISPEWTAAKALTNSPFTFVTTGTIEDPLALDGTTKIKTNATFGVNLFDRLFTFYTLAEMAMANTSNNVKFEITRETPHTFNFWKNYGSAKVDYAGVFPGNITEHDFDAGREHQRLDLFTVVSDGAGGQTTYEVSTADVNTSTLRRLQAAIPIRTLFGASGGTTETDQQKAALARQLIVSTRYPNAVRIRPRQGEIDIFNGHDLGDTFRHTIERADRGGDFYDGYLRLIGVAGAWTPQHGEMIDLYLRGAI